MLRIISGKYKGHKLLTPSGKETRPIPEMVREALFSILQEEVLGIKVIDFFAGSGSVGLEALSRGAERVVFVEASASARKVIEQNINNLACKAQTKIINYDLSNPSDGLIKETGSADLVFLGPPYGFPQTAQLMDFIAQKKILNPNGLLTVQYYWAEKIEEKVFNYLERVYVKKYGQNILGFYRYKNRGAKE